MSGSLRDQLLKAGIVSEAQVRDARAKAKKKTKQARNTKRSAKKPPDTDSVSYRATQAQAQKVARDRALNRRKVAELEKTAVRARVRDLIDRNQANDPSGNIAHNFVEERRIKRVYVTDRQQRELSEGNLAIVAFKGRHYVIPIKIADKIREIDPGVFISICKDGSDNDRDDPYAEYPVPDDLMW